jgi:hypothetical protein
MGGEGGVAGRTTGGAGGIDDGGCEFDGACAESWAAEVSSPDATAEDDAGSIALSAWPSAGGSFDTRSPEGIAATEAGSPESDEGGAGFADAVSSGAAWLARWGTA